MVPATRRWPEPVKWNERAADLGYAAGWRVVRALPEGFACRAFDLAADLAARRARSKTTQLHRNLARVLGVSPAEVPDALYRDAMRSYARYWREAFRLPSMDRAALAAAVDADVEGQEHLDAAVAAGAGVVLALPHSGNWDVAGVWLVSHVGGFSTVAERLKPESLYVRFVAYRESLGFEILPLTGGAESPIRGLVRRLRGGGVICLVGDRDLTKAGIPVRFFGEEARMPAGPARLAKSTGAALLPVHCWFTPQGWRIRIHPPVDPALDVAAATQAMADRFAEGIAAHPADWHMLQPLWLSDVRRAP